MKHLSAKKKLILKDLQDKYNYSKNSSKRQDWIKRANYHLNFKDGKQWQEEKLNEDMKDIGARQYTQNFIKTSISNVLSILLRENTQIGYSSLYDIPESLKTAENLKRKVFEVQEENNSTDLNYQRFEGALGTGLGWHHFLMNEDMKIKIEVIDPRDVFFDPDDDSYRFTEQEFTGYKKWMSFTKFEIEYPEFADEVKKSIDLNRNQTQLDIRKDSYLDEDNIWIKGKKVKVIIMYYRKVVDFYETVAKYNNLQVVYQTFNYDLAKSKSQNGKILTKKGTQIWRGTFHDNFLLENIAISSQTPNEPYLRIGPVVFDKDSKGIPQGCIGDMIDTQILNNVSLSKGMHYSTSKLMIASDVGIDTKKVAEDYKSESRKVNGCIFFPDPEKIQIINNDHGVNHLFNIYKMNERTKENIATMNPDFLGGRGNVTSGIGKQVVEYLTIQAKNPALLANEAAIKISGRIMLDMFRGTDDFKATLRYYKEGKLVVDEIQNDSLLIDFGVYSDKVSKYSSTLEQSRQILMNLSESQVGQQELISPFRLNRIWGVEEQLAYEVAEDKIKTNKLVMNGFKTEEEIAEANQALQMQAQQIPQNNQ